MIEGRSGGSGRGTRRELWAPPDRGSAQPADRTLYRVPTLDPRRPLISSRRFLTLAPPAGHGEKFRRTRAYVPLGTRLRRMAGPKGKTRKEATDQLGGALEESCGPHMTAVLLNQRIVRCIVYRRSTLAAHSFPPAASS